MHLILSKHCQLFTIINLWLIWKPKYKKETCPDSYIY